MTRNDIEVVDCNLCKGKEKRILIDFEKDFDKKFDNVVSSFKVVQCRNCGLVYVNPRPLKEKMKNYYPKEYYHMFDGVKLGFQVQYYSSGGLWRLNDLPKGRVLDFGCGSGNYLKILKDLGWDAIGLDTEECAVEEAREKSGLTVYCCELEQVKFPSNYFDVVTMNHVIEHLYDPVSTLIEIHRILKSEGLLMIGTNNVLAIMPYIKKRNIAPIMNQLDVPRHLYHFSPMTLRALFKKTGFKVSYEDYGPSRVIDMVHRFSCKLNRNFLVDNFTIRAISKFNLLLAYNRGWMMVFRGLKKEKVDD